MSNVPIKDGDGNTRKVDTFTRTEGADTVETQAVVLVDPSSGAPLNLATETGVAALLAVAQAIQTAAQALNEKTTAVNTSNIGGTVALDAPSLAALEVVTVANMVQQGLTDQQLRAAPVTVADAAAAGALSSIDAQAATIADLQSRLIELNETMTYFLGAMLEKMPRLDAGDRLMARVVLNGENDLNSAYGGVALNSVGNPSTGAQFMRTFEPWNFSDAGAARIYQQIQVTA